ncbi:MAG: hypothetical protein ABL921_31770 [Pirellula sp.]
MLKIPYASRKIDATGSSVILYAKTGREDALATAQEIPASGMLFKVIRVRYLGADEKE